MISTCCGLIGPERETYGKGGEGIPLAQLKGLSGYLNVEQKSELIRKVTDAIVSVEGEGLRPVTWVIIEEVPS
jgi:phenylpyruvate tautomerase PptA (4-oxalocrotonate tautomerase family)